ncbi:MAG: hypothetical protein M5U28_44480 [Sandaracinaceae bacterium]|nr:hypothetical protein [Sandaracinaceae bacterium]
MPASSSDSDAATTRSESGSAPTTATHAPCQRTCRARPGSPAPSACAMSGSSASIHPKPITLMVKKTPLPSPTAASGTSPSRPTMAVSTTLRSIEPRCVARSGPASAASAPSSDRRVARA